MPRFKQSVYAAAGVLLLGIVFSLVTTTRGDAATATLVQVVNTASQWASPVPVSGSVGVSGSVQTTQSGTWTVGVHDLDAARKPIHAHVQFTVAPSSPGSGGTLAYTVPAGERFILEYVSARVAGGKKDDTLFGIGGSTSSTKVQTFGATAIPNETLGGWIMSQAVRMYFEPGEQVLVDSNRSITSTGSGVTPLVVQFDLDGRLVDVVP